ncbi:MAG: YdiU family protein [Pseudomonadota bacterium]
MDFPFENSYANLPERLYTKLAPTPVKTPKLIAYNTALAAELNIKGTPEAAVFAGNTVPEMADPLAQVYAGHQFGHWNPQLGDGRAILLGEVAGHDVQLKGSGPTPYSRMGDGRAWLGPVLREYVVSEFMNAAGVPTTRALAAVTTGETVLRETPLPGAILTRVAASHIRVGTFQYFASRTDAPALQALVDHCIARHYPDADGPQGLLDAVVQAQATLIAKWMSLGFIHGVMNTDNCAISGETIDYGPCAFMDAYHPETKFSSIDQFGRYAYNNQPDIAAWNLAQLATSLLQLMPDRDAAIESFTESVNSFIPAFQKAYGAIFMSKIGISEVQQGDMALVTDLLDRMAANQADFTNTFRGLSEGGARDQFVDPTAFDGWAEGWTTRIASEPASQAVMRAANPAIIPRNHRIEEMIQAAVAGDYAPFERLNTALATPYTLDQTHHDLTTPPTEQEIVHQTFCGT